jgi:cytidine deaminase
LCFFFFQDRKTQDLFEASISVRENAYAPYSKFKVGAALIDSSGKIYTGCNVENASYGLTTCAERSAIAKAVSDGQRKFVSIAVCAAFEDNVNFVAPCGGCRQNINEFRCKDTDIVIYLVKPDRGKILETTIGSLLPLSFMF